MEGDTHKHTHTHQAPPIHYTALGNSGSEPTNHTISGKARSKKMRSQNYVKSYNEYYSFKYVYTILIISKILALNPLGHISDSIIVVILLL